MGIILFKLKHRKKGYKVGKDTVKMEKVPKNWHGEASEAPPRRRSGSKHQTTIKLKFDQFAKQTMLCACL